MEMPPDERLPDRVEVVSGNVLGATVVFLLLQVPVIVVFLLVSVLLPGLGVFTPAVGETLGAVLTLLAEAVLVLSLVRMIRRRIAKLPVAVQGSSLDPAAQAPSFERRLERSMLLAAMIVIAASLLLGLGSPGNRVALAVVDAFAALFLLIVIATRWWLTHRVSAWALLALGAALFSLLRAFGVLRP